MGFAHPDIWLEQITSTQLAEWEAYDRLEPVDHEQRSDLRFASLISVVVNISRSIWGKKDCKMTTPEDFMPKWGATYDKKAPQRQSVEDMKQVLMSIASNFKRGKK